MRGVQLWFTFLYQGDGEIYTHMWKLYKNNNLLLEIFIISTL